MKTSYFVLILAIVVLLAITGCTKNGVNTSSLYTPTSANITANATLQELQQGRVLFINNCGQCHGLYPPDNYTPAQWRSILPIMTPRTNLSASDISLLTKYACKGN